MRGIAHMAHCEKHCQFLVTIDDRGQNHGVFAPVVRRTFDGIAPEHDVSALAERADDIAQNPIAAGERE